MMAKLNLEMDTQEGLMSVSVNGKTVENVRSIEISHFPESQFGDAESHFVITTIEVDRDSDLSQITRIMAEDSVLGKEAVAKGAVADKSGLVKVPGETKVSQDIHKFCSK